MRPLVAGPGLDKRAIDGEVFVGEQAALVGQGEDFGKEGFDDFVFQQPVAVLGEDGVVPDVVFHGDADEPAGMIRKAAFLRGEFQQSVNGQSGLNPGQNGFSLFSHQSRDGRENGQRELGHGIGVGLDDLYLAAAAIYQDEGDAARASIDEATERS
jgi:hypothetical protein